jgi:hypothetical protein
MDPNNSSIDIAAKVKSFMEEANLHVKQGRKDKAAKVVVKGVAEIFKGPKIKSVFKEATQHVKQGRDKAKKAVVKGAKYLIKEHSAKKKNNNNNNSGENGQAW